MNSDTNTPEDSTPPAAAEAPTPAAEEQANNSTQTTASTAQDKDDIPEISPRDTKYFNEEIDALLNYAEELRLNAMKAQRNRGFVAMSVGLSTIVLGATGFGWFLLVDAAILNALGSITLGVVVAVALHLWSMQSLQDYQADHKTHFLPKMAKLLGGFSYYPARGISRKVLARTGVIPAHDIYEAEDCFMGKYKGMKVMFSEARLRHKKGYMEPIFNGLFVLLEAPNAPIEGHTILTANKEMIHRWGKTRWKKLSSVDANSENPMWNKFSGFSDNSESAEKLITEPLLKELSEAADIFDQSPITAVFFQKKFIFIMIPYDGDMFEASDMQVPVATKRHALKCKKEIDQIVEIIDVFDVYNS
jgi:hypothetical protein